MTFINAVKIQPRLFQSLKKDGNSTLKSIVKLVLVVLLGSVRRNGKHWF
jgi:hypothetical protein